MFSSVRNIREVDQQQLPMLIASRGHNVRDFGSLALTFDEHMIAVRQLFANVQVLAMFATVKRTSPVDVSSFPLHSKPHIQCTQPHSGKFVCLTSIWMVPFEIALGQCDFLTCSQYNNKNNKLKHL